MFSKLVLCLVFTSAATAAHCQKNSWNGIVPLKSTRPEVEQILGKPEEYSKDKFSAFYLTENERVFVLYSNGPCRMHPGSGWDLPELTVISISVYPKNEPDFDESKIDLKDFEKHPDPASLSSVAYTNEKDGIGILVNTWSKVITSYEYRPASRNYHLKCKSK